MVQPKLTEAYNGDGSEPPNGAYILLVKYKGSGTPFSSILKQEEFCEAVIKEAFRKILKYLGGNDAWDISVVEDIEALLKKDQEDRLYLPAQYIFKPAFDDFTGSVGFDVWKESIEIQDSKIINANFGVYNP